MGRRLGGSAVGVYGSRRYIKGRDPDDLASLDWIRWAKTWRHVGTEQWIQRHVPAANIRAEVNNNLAATELIAAGLGVGFQPRWSADPDRRLHRIGSAFDFKINLWLLTHEDLRRTARVSAFMKFMGDAVLEQRARLEHDDSR